MLDRAGRSPLHYVALEGDADAVGRLIAQGEDPNLADRADFTPLHFAAQSLHADAELEARNKFGATPLLVALGRVRDTDGEVVRVLLAAGADKNAENASGQTPWPSHVSSPTSTSCDSSLAIPEAMAEV